jgi:hypothetical protein
VLLNLFIWNAGLEKELDDLKDTAQYVIDLYVPHEEGVEPKPLINWLDEAEGRIKGLLLDTTKLAAAVALSTVKYHNPSFDLQKVSKRRGLVRLGEARGCRGGHGGGRQQVRLQHWLSCAEISCRCGLGRGSDGVNELAS